ncbi:MAG TPA: DUF4012 domain-containing protein [Actinomycetota bacterium]
MTTTEVIPAQSDDPQQPRRPRRARRWLLRILAVLGVLIVLAGGGLAITVWATKGVRDDLSAGRRAMRDGGRAVQAGRLDAAADAFARAEDSFQDAAEGTASGLAGIAGNLPLLGRNLDVARGVAEAGTELAQAGAELVGAVDTLPDGLSSLAPRDGSLPLQEIGSLGGEIGGAEDHATAAVELVATTPSTWLVGPVSDARAEAAQQVGEVADAITSLRMMLQGLPGFAGADGERRYFFVAESPAEQRGTGGIWGAYSIVTVRDGRFHFAPFKPIQRLPDLDVDQLPAPNPDYRANYDQYGGAGFWRNMNMTPDFPSAARAVLNAYELHTGERLNGVMSADPFALQELLKVTGPRTVPGLDLKIDAESVVAFTTNEAYIRYDGDPELRKAILGDVAKGVFEQFLAMDDHDAGRLRAVARSVSSGHLKIYTDTDPAFEEGLALAQADGALIASAGNDLSAVIVNSGSGSKIDFYATRTVEYDVQLTDEGRAIASTEVTIANDAPTSGVPDYVIDPIPPFAEPGDNVSLVRILCPARCDLLTAQRNDEKRGLATGSELGLTWYQDFFSIPAGTTGSLRIQTKLENVWEGNSSVGTYRLTFLNQTTVEPTTASITIHAPEGQEIVWTSQQMQVSGDTATWKGQPGPRTEFEVRSAAPIPTRWWRDLTRPLGL